MARSIDEIKLEMDAEQASYSELSGLTSPSQTAVYNLWKYIVASAIWAHETLWDIFRTEIETKIANAPIGTNQWVQSKVFEFQYSDTLPQVVTLVGFVPRYSSVNEDLRIVTRASVKTLPNRIVYVKVAKSEPPVALNSLELDSLKGYLDEISFAGVQYNAVSMEADRLFIEATVNYQGQYASIIDALVTTGIEGYLASLPFDGYVRVNALIDAIQSVEGVTDVTIHNLAIRKEADLFADKIYIVQNNATIFNKYPTFAGYVVVEDESGETLADKVTYLPEM